jgi:hypothetical protein
LWPITGDSELRIADCGLRIAEPPIKPRPVAAETALPRDESLRSLYAQAALTHIPRLLTCIDRNPYRATYGCCDRQFWHYRTSDFPSEMYQEEAWPLALVYSYALPGNRWQGEPRLRELAIAALRFSARSCHRDGSCDDYYPYERALGAAVFSLLAASQTYRLLELDDAEILAWLERRAAWVARHDESGRLSNHQALAALGLLHVAAITQKRRYRQAAEERLHRLLSWQSDEGWFDEYGGADPGYQTVTLDCLVKCRRLLECRPVSPRPAAGFGETGLHWLDEPIARGVRFCRLFLHPDSSYGGEYGSRGTYHFYPHGFELLAGENADAADLADGFLTSLMREKGACFDDDRLVAHRLGNLIESYVDWSPTREASDREPVNSIEFLPKARMLVRRDGQAQTIVSAARGGVFKHFQSEISNLKSQITDAGLIVELADGRIAVSQSHDLSRKAVYCPHGSRLTVEGPLHRARFETATPVKFIVLRLGMLLAGRWFRTCVRRVLQRRLITGRRECPVCLRRAFEFLPGGGLRVTDTIELTGPRVRVRRMSFGTDHQAAYVAASGVYQDAVLEPWQDLEQHVSQLNRQRRVEIVRQW